MTGDEAMKADRTRIGFIGAGNIASRHLGNLLGFDDVQVVGLADLQLDRAQQAASRCDATAYTDYNEMLDRERLDAVYVCLPPFAHGTPEAAVIERGLPFFVEKPLASDLETAVEVAHRVRQRGVLTAVGYHWRYLDITERAQTLLRATPARLALGYWLDSTPPPAWWTQQARSGGQMVEQTTHIFDLARLLVGEVTSVTAVAARSARPGHPADDIADVSVATLHFASGALGSIASTCLLGWPHRIGLHFFGDGLAIELSESELMIDVGRGRPVHRAEGDPFVREDRDFVDAVRGRPNHIRVPYSEALETHRLVTGAVRSAREGRSITLRPETVEARNEESGDLV